MTEDRQDRQKFKIYVRRSGKVKAKGKSPSPTRNPSSAVAFVLRHVSGRTYEEAVAEAERLLKIVDHTPADRAAIKQVLQSRCPRKSQ
jgi:hypothetical protein